MSDAVNPSEVLLTEDGHPIGELVISDGSSVAAMPDRATEESNREQLMLEAAAEMTGNPDADKAVAELYPGYGDTDRRRKAMVAFVTEGRTIEEAAAASGVPARTVSMWVYNGKWDELVKREIAAKQSQSVLDLARLRADKRLEIAKEQYAQAKELRDLAMEKVRNDETSIKSGTEAWAAAAKIEHTLSGVSEAGEVTGIGDGDGKKKDTGGKQPLVMVFQGGLPPVRRHE